MLLVRHRSRRFASFIAAGAALSGLIASPRSAGAQLIGPHVISSGIFLGVAFGPKTTFALGADLRYTYVAQSAQCGTGTVLPWGGGAFAQATVLNFAAWRFAAGLHGGAAPAGVFYAIDGELGWTYRTADRRVEETAVGALPVAIPAAHGIHLGLLQAFMIAGELAARAAIPIAAPAGARTPEGILSVGVRYPPPFGLQPVACAGAL